MELEQYEKKALLICPCYKALPCKFQLTCTLNDIKSIKDIIMQKFGFKEEQITVLKEDKATRANILQVFDDFICEDYGVVFFYYSGHGVFIPESKDEGLLPTVYEWPVETGKAKEFCITGKDMFPFLEKLSKKRARCTMILDCCHSGQLYRVTEFNENDLRPRQVVLKQSLTKERPKALVRMSSLLDRRSWLPSVKDYFFYFAACSSVEVALEEMYKGGRMTMAVVDVLNKIVFPEKVSYDAFFRLLKKEFKRKDWDKHQTPQFEAVNSNTVLFAIDKVQESKGGIEIADVLNRYEVIVNCGYLQNLRPGRYLVFDPTASKEDVESIGIKSEQCVGIININSSLIGPAQSTGAILQTLENREISVGCLAYLNSPDTPSINIHVSPTPGSVDENSIQDLANKLQATMTLNVSREGSRFAEDPHLITITCEEVERKKAWVARRGDKILVPAITIDHDKTTMAENLCRHLRYHFALANAKSPRNAEDVLDNVSFKVSKLSNLAYSRRYKQNLSDILNNGTEIIEYAEQMAFFKGFETERDTIRPGNTSGDYFSYTVTNENEQTGDVIHICVMFYEFDGGIRCLYPRKKGETAELKGGDSYKDLWPLYIPQNSLRSMVEPDTSKEEPNIGVDTLVLYASSKPLNYGALQQTGIEVDNDILPRFGGPKLGQCSLSEWDEFLKIQKRLIPQSDLEDPIKLFIQKIEIPVKK